MPPRRSAGLLLYRAEPAVRVLLGHMGGPFWARRDDRAWSIPKGEYEPDEEPFAAACREFAEELGSPAPQVTYIELGETRIPGGKVITVWAGESDFTAEDIAGNTFELQWPPRSGRVQQFPEIDRAGWFTLDVAARKLVAGQTVFLDRLDELLRNPPRA